jgi:hypothetical protein
LDRRPSSPAVEYDPMRAMLVIWAVIIIGGLSYFIAIGAIGR